MENYSHCILVCSDYATGTRNGIHFLFNETNVVDIARIVTRYTEKEGVSMYIVATDKPTIESVQKKDAFFKNIRIVEGSDNKNLFDFDKFLGNQIGVLDFALLLLSRDNLSIDDLKLYLHVCYIVFAYTKQAFPFKEKLYIKPDFIGFKPIGDAFSKVLENEIIRCTKPDVIMSKFFNTEGGTNLMNDLLKCYYLIKSKEKDVVEVEYKTFISNVINNIKNRKRYRKGELYLTKRKIKDNYCFSFRTNN